MGKKTNTISIFLMLIITIHIAYPMGLIGSDLNFMLDFEPGLEQTYNYKLRTTSPKSMDYQLYVDSKGEFDLTPYFSLSQEVMEDIPSNKRVPFQAHMKLPEDIPIPGVHEIRIGAIETEASGGMMGSRSGSEAIIRVRVRYPGEYLKSAFKPEYDSQEDKALFSLKLENYGDTKISDCYAIITLEDPKGEVVGKLTTKTFEIGIDDVIEHEEEMSLKNLSPGTYTALAEIFWSGETHNHEDSLQKGVKNVAYVNHTKKVELGGIRKFDIMVESEWNEPITNVYATGDFQGVSVQTSPITIKPFQKAELNGFFDSSSLMEGNYTGKIIVNFEGGRSAADAVVEVIPEMIEEDEKKDSIIKSMDPLTLTLAVAVIIIVILNIIVVTILLTRKKKGEDKESVRSVGKNKTKRGKKK